MCVAFFACTQLSEVEFKYGNYILRRKSRSLENSYLAYCISEIATVIA